MNIVEDVWGDGTSVHFEGSVAIGISLVLVVGSYLSWLGFYFVFCFVILLGFGIVLSLL